MRSFVPNEKNSASVAISSAVKAALGISIIVPTLYFKSIPDSAIILLAVSVIIDLTNANSLSSPTKGTIISGTIFHSGCLLVTLIAALITAFVCILATSGNVTERRQPL